MSFIHIGKPIPFDTETFLGQLGELARASYNNDENIVEMVEKIVPTFNPVGDKPTGNEKIWQKRCCSFCGKIIKDPYFSTAGISAVLFLSLKFHTFS